MGEEGAVPRASVQRGREAHAEEVARAMRENLKKRKARARARRAQAEAAAPDACGGEGDPHES
jgi:hypothetical protein